MYCVLKYYWEGVPDNEIRIVRHTELWNKYHMNVPGFEIGIKCEANSEIDN